MYAIDDAIYSRLGLIVIWVDPQAPSIPGFPLRTDESLDLKYIICGAPNKVGTCLEVFGPALCVNVQHGLCILYLYL